MQSLSLLFCHCCWNEINTDVNSHACLHTLQLQRQSCQIKSNENTAFLDLILRLSRQNNGTAIIELTWWLSVGSTSCTDWIGMEPSLSHSSLLCTPGHTRSPEECINWECRALKWWTLGVAGRIKFVMISVPLLVQRLINPGTWLIYAAPEVLIKMF